MTKPFILIVEDNPDEAMLMREALATVIDGLTLTVMSTVDEALAWLAIQPDDRLPALVVTDHHLPDRTGHELIVALRASARNQRLPVVMLSGDDHQPLGMAGVSWYGKPATWEGWRALARELIQQHLPQATTRHRSGRRPASRRD
jgi:CheY-like chemotaxis protein